MPRKKNLFAVPGKRGPKKILESKIDKTFSFDEKHLGMIAAYRASHPEIESDSAVVRLAIETLCGPGPTQEEEKEGS